MTETNQKIVKEDILCFHCGEECSNDQIAIDDKYFCCNGCKTVFELLDQNDLCNYYNIDDTPGISQKNDIQRNYDFLDDKDLKKKLIDFTDGNTTTTTFTIPQMHCSSCIWILENLYKLNPGVLRSEVNFLNKKLSVHFEESKTSIKSVVELLEALGYAPLLNLDESSYKKNENENKQLYYQIGVAGFCFGNIMLLSFPEYLSFIDSETEALKYIFNYLNIILSLPVLLFSSKPYISSAIKGLKKKIINIDVPIALGIIVLFLRSIYEIFIFNNAGYLDSLAGLVFFLLIGKLFQNKTYETLNFERNYKSYFPISVTINKNGNETTIPIEKLSLKNRIIVKNNELIPADAVLINGNANIDYSFVTGESQPINRENGELIYAGGRQVGEAIEVEIVKEVSQSYLTQLWNKESFDKNKESNFNTISNSVSKYFTFGILFIAIASAIYWIQINSGTAFNTFTAVLIVACPCALALSIPFTLGHSLRIFGKNSFYLKNTAVIENLSSITSIVFDKTGTLTKTGETKVEFIGDEVSDYYDKLIKSVTRNSSHPLSIMISKNLNSDNYFEINEYSEFAGKGIEAILDDKIIRIGSKDFASYSGDVEEFIGSKVFITINNESFGYFRFSNVYRNGFENILSNLKNKYNLSLLSGDSESEKEKLKKLFPEKSKLYFNQTPFDKLSFIEDLQNKGERVLMIGDGLNDAGALKQSDVGISISEDINNFSPSCDGILDADSFSKLNKFIVFSGTSKKIIIISFIISFLYNIVGLSFAVSGNLSPLVAAILMPLSSISVVVFTTFATNFLALKRKLI